MKTKGFAILLCAIMVAACSEDPYDKDTMRDEPDQPQSMRPSGPIEKRIEVPKVGNRKNLIVHSTVCDEDTIMTYCLEFEPQKYHSKWVAFRFDGITRQKSTGRQDFFDDDPSLPSDYQIGSKAFGTPYDRGHICASADRLYNEEANLQTFYMSNMSPQLSSFNQHYWTRYESFVQNLGRNMNFADTLYVTKGGTISDDKIIGYVTRQNGTKIAVPRYYFMALLAVKNRKYNAIGFLMEHKDYGVKSADDVSINDVKTHVVSIDALEKFTDIDFFFNLPDEIENEVEAKVNESFWGL